MAFRKCKQKYPGKSQNETSGSSVQIAIAKFTTS